MTAIAACPGRLERAEHPALYVVMIDVDCGHEPIPQWVRNSPAKPLAGALEEAREVRADGGICNGPR